MHALIGYSNSEYPLLFTSEQLARAPENIVLSFHELFTSVSVNSGGYLPPLQ